MHNYGPYHFPDKLIPLMIARALANQPLPVYSKGENVRDWLYVEDHCSAIDRIIRDGRVGEVYNIGGHNERTNLEVVKTILRELDKPESLISFVTDRPGHDQRYAIDPGKIHRELGWLPATRFDEGRWVKTRLRLLLIVILSFEFPVFLVLMDPILSKRCCDWDMRKAKSAL